MAWPDGRELVRTGALEGRIAREPRGSAGFGYDPVFLLPDHGLSLAELPPEVKNALGHRGQAVRAVVEALAGT